MSKTRVVKIDNKDCTISGLKLKDLKSFFQIQRDILANSEITMEEKIDGMLDIVALGLKNEHPDVTSTVLGDMLEYEEANEFVKIIGSLSGLKMGGDDDSTGE